MHPLHPYTHVHLYTHTHIRPYSYTLKHPYNCLSSMGGMGCISCVVLHVA